MYHHSEVQALVAFGLENNVLVGPSHTRIEVSTRSGIFFYFVYRLIRTSCMDGSYAAAYMLSHSFAPIYEGGDWIREGPRPEAMAYM